MAPRRPPVGEPGAAPVAQAAELGAPDGGDRLSLFATPVAVFHLEGHEALHRELLARLIPESQATPGLRRSNAGGWHSLPDLAQRPDPAFQQLVRMIVDHVARVGHEQYLLAGRPPPAGLRYGVQAWAMVMRDGDHTVLHDHGEAHWSSAYYLDAGDADLARFPASGALAFVDPRRGGRALPGLDAGATFEVRPRAGMLVIFPGWLQHYVHPYRGARPRVAISCNVVVEAVAAAGEPSGPSGVGRPRRAQRSPIGTGGSDIR